MIKKYNLVDFKLENLKIVRQSTTKYPNENHTRTTYYDEVNKIYIKIWAEDYVRKDNLNLIDFNFFNGLIPNFLGFIEHNNITRGYVTREAIENKKTYKYLLSKLIENTKKFGVFLNDFCEGHCYEFEGKPCLIDIEGVWFIDDYKDLVEHHIKVENPTGPPFVVDSNYKSVVDYLYKYVPISLQYFLRCDLHKGRGGKEIPLLDYKLDTVLDVVNYWNEERINETLPTLKPVNWQYFNCMLAEFRHNVENHHVRRNENMTLEYYNSLPKMSDEEIRNYLIEVPCEFDEYFIKHSVHRAYAMMGRLINGKPYIPFYMDIDKVHINTTTLDNINYISSLIDISTDEFTIVQSGILALMGVRQNDDLDIVVSSKLKKNISNLKGIEYMLDHPKFRVFGCESDDDLVYKYSKKIGGVKFAQPRFYFSRKNKNSERDISDWEQMKLFFNHGSHLTYPYRKFTEKEWGIEYV